MRVFSNSIMAVLIVAALFWGNCFSCPQMLAAQAHQCCHHTKTPKAACQQQNLKSFVKAGTTSSAAPAASRILETPPLVVTASAASPKPVTVESDPPAPLSLRI